MEKQRWSSTCGRDSRYLRPQFALPAAAIRITCGRKQIKSKVLHLTSEALCLSMMTDWMIDVIEARQNEGNGRDWKTDSFYLKAQISFRHSKALSNVASSGFVIILRKKEC